MTLKQRVDQHDREIAAIRKLVVTGMKMLSRMNDHLDRVDDRLDRVAASQEKLTASQLETDRMLKDLIRSLKGGGNGHAKRKIGIQ